MAELSCVPNRSRTWPKFCRVINTFFSSVAEMSVRGRNVVPTDDTDSRSTNCVARSWGGGWWYINNCFSSNLNGSPYNGSSDGVAGIQWKTYRYKESLKSSRMMIRPSKPRCKHETCLNNATCFDNDGGFICRCPSGFEGFSKKAWALGKSKIEILSKSHRQPLANIRNRRTWRAAN